MKKIKIETLSEDSVEKIKKLNLEKARYYFQLAPFSTKLYLSMKSGVSLGFINEHWDEITK